MFINFGSVLCPRSILSLGHGFVRLTPLENSVISKRVERYSVGAGVLVDNGVPCGSGDQEFLLALDQTQQQGQA